ncbi:hypothetical protein JL720_16527 [Aureococcus anophagefferens]|nr:hypothetical protein JL720_16527 [Aureococcus anophagefferens]
MGPTLKCKTCERKCNARRSRAPEEKKEDKEFMKVMKGYRYKFESYSVESVRLCEEKYPGFMAKQDFVITTRRTAMTRTLADIFSFREKKVGGAIIAIDHTLKTLKGQKVAQEKVSKNRLTVWSSGRAR